jgi:hypothetical protein
MTGVLAEFLELRGLKKSTNQREDKSAFWMTAVPLSWCQEHKKRSLIHHHIAYVFALTSHMCMDVFAHFSSPDEICTSESPLCLYGFWRKTIERPFRPPRGVPSEWTIDNFWDPHNYKKRQFWVPHLFCSCIIDKKKIIGTLKLHHWQFCRSRACRLHSKNFKNPILQIRFHLHWVINLIAAWQPCNSNDLCLLAYSDLEEEPSGIDFLTSVGIGIGFLLKCRFSVGIGFGFRDWKKLSVFVSFFEK